MKAMNQNNKKRLLIIPDFAHGSDVPGKQSPDGSHKEWNWSREMFAEIIPELKALGYAVMPTNESDKEIGLTVRQRKANEFAKQHPDLIAFLVSLHNDAKGNGTSWENASGISVWTSKGETRSDVFAEIFIQSFIDLIPDVKHRIYSPKKLQRDFEANFTVLMGAKYLAILIECMFQDNRDDVEKLKDTEFRNKVKTCIIEAIEKCNQYAIDNKW